MNDTNQGEGAYRETPEEKEILRLEKLLRDTVDERDEAQQAVSQIYYIVFGLSAEWSNVFGMANAVEEITDAVNALKLAINKPAETEEICCPKCGGNEVEKRHGLAAGGLETDYKECDLCLHQWDHQ